ncbi:MAG: hypothetical protein H2184_13265 [Candidatus Galacturonibacter soehngenii]|nr:hypothetical protein [Candidatus Galacturonibacter soehngenii]
MENKKIDIANEYSRELNEISYILNNLENGRIYEKTGWTQDGYLATNIQKLRKEMTNLLIKIENGEDGDKKRIREALEKYHDK